MSLGKEGGHKSTLEHGEKSAPGLVPDRAFICIVESFKACFTCLQKYIFWPIYVLLVIAIPAPIIIMSPRSASPCLLPQSPRLGDDLVPDLGDSERKTCICFGDAYDYSDISLPTRSGAPHIGENVPNKVHKICQKSYPAT